MEFGVSIGNFGTYGKRGDVHAQLAIAQRAELLGFDSVWVHDHLFMPAKIDARYPYNATGVAGFAYRQDIYDPLAMMAAVAVRTRRVRIGTSVLIIPYRNPVVLAKMLATLDHLSHGRIILGLGVGWMADEFEALGMGEYFPVRGAVTDEWIRICIELWTSDGLATHEGRFRSFKGIGSRPRPVQKPHIPLWVGGSGDVAHRRVARYGQGYQTISATPGEVQAQVQAVHQEMERHGRDPSELTISMLGPRVTIGARAGAELAPASISGSKQEIIDGLAAYAAAGLEHAIATPAIAYDPEATPEATMEAMQYMAEEIIPAVR